MDNLRNSSRRRQDSSKLSNYKIVSVKGLRSVPFTGTNGSGLALAKFGNFTSQNVTLRETAINNRIIRIPLFNDNLCDLKRRHAFKTLNTRKNKLEQALKKSSYGRKIKQNTFYSFDDGLIDVKAENSEKSKLDTTTTNKNNLYTRSSGSSPNKSSSKIIQAKKGTFKDDLKSSSKMQNKITANRSFDTSPKKSFDKSPQKQPNLKDLKQSLNNKLRSRYTGNNSDKEKTLNKTIKKEKDKLKVKWFGKESAINKKKKVKGEIPHEIQPLIKTGKVPEIPLTLHREILFVNQYKNSQLQQIKSNTELSTYYLKFQTIYRQFNDGKLAYHFQKLVTDVKYMKLPSPTWKIKVIIRQGKIAAITFTNKLVMERCVSFCSQNDFYRITIDNRPALLVGSPGKVESSKDIEILLDIVQNIEPKNPMLLFK